MPGPIIVVSPRTVEGAVASEAEGSALRDRRANAAFERREPGAETSASCRARHRRLRGSRRGRVLARPAVGCEQAPGGRSGRSQSDDVVSRLDSVCAFARPQPVLVELHRLPGRREPVGEHLRTAARPSGCPGHARARANSSFNLLMRIALASSATSMFLVSRRWARWWPAAFAAGLLYGFGSYMTFESSIHLDLAFMPVPPLLLWCFDELFVAQRRDPLKMGILLGLLSAAQLLIDVEVLLFCAIVAAIGLLVLALAHRRDVVARVRFAAPGLLGALALFAVIAAYPVGYFLEGPGRIPHGIQLAWITAGYHLDLLQPVRRVVPQQIVGGPLVENGRLVKVVHWPWFNTSGYLGIPLLVVIAALAVLWRKLGIIRFSALLALVTFVLSLGPRLTIDGHVYRVWLPEALFERVPVLMDLEPVRLTGVGTIFLAVILAVGLDRTRSWIVGRDTLAAAEPTVGRQAIGASRSRFLGRPRATLMTLGLLIVVIGAFVPLLQQLPVVRELPATAPGITASLAHSVPNGGVVLAFPYPRAANDEPMLWQAEDEMRFRIVGGYALVPGAKGLGRYYVAPDPELAEWNRVLTDPSLAPRMSIADACRSLGAVFRQHDVDALVLRTRAGATRARGVALLTEVLGAPSVRFGSGVVWYDPRHSYAPACSVRS